MATSRFIIQWVGTRYDMVRPNIKTRANSLGYSKKQMRNKKLVNAAIFI